MWGVKKRQAFLGDNQLQDKRQWALTKIQGIPFKHKTKNYEADQRVKQDTWRVCGGSILGDIQNQTAHGPEQPSWSQGLD